MSAATISRVLTARRLAPTGGVLVAMIVTGGAGIPQFGMPWAFDSVVPYLVDPAPPCDLPADPIADDPAGYYECAEHLYWRIDPSLLEAATADDAAEARINQLVLAAATCGLILLVRRRLCGVDGKVLSPSGAQRR